MTLSKDRRRLYTVDRGIRAFFLTVWTAAVALVALFAAFTWLVRQAYPVEFPQVFGQNLFLVMFVAAFFMIGAAICLSIYAVVHTHRLLGSAYRIHEALKQMKAGVKADPVVLRDGDYFRDIAADVNELRERLQPAGQR